MNESAFDFDKLSPTQLAAMGKLMMGDDTCISRSTGDSLVKKGYAVRCDEQEGLFTIRHYMMPIHVHIRWCAWCEDNFDDEGNRKPKGSPAPSAHREKQGRRAQGWEPRQSGPAGASRAT